MPDCLPRIPTRWYTIDNSTISGFSAFIVVKALIPVMPHLVHPLPHIFICDYQNNLIRFWHNPRNREKTS